MSTPTPGENQAIIDPAEFRRILGHFASGVVIVTATSDDRPVGMTAQTFSSLSLDPPLVMFAPARTSTTWPHIKSVGHFAINVLNRNQHDLGTSFARSGGNKFGAVDWTAGVNGSPLLEGCLAYLECSLRSVYDGGDHEIAVGEVVGARADSEHNPLVFYRSGFGDFQTFAS